MENAPATLDAPALADAASGKGTLRHGALGLRHAIIISVAVMSPAASIIFNSKPQAAAVGAAIPFCMVVGFVVALLVANQYSEFSRELPSSGSAYTFVTEGLGPRWGFLTGWIGLIAIVLGVPYTFAIMSGNLEELVGRWFGVQVHWSVFYVAALGLVFALCYIGIRQSLAVDLTLLIFEVGVCLVLAALIFLVVGGKGGLSAAPFSPSSAPDAGNLAIGIVFAVLSFIGFETAAALGEETRNPRRNIPRAVYGSMIVVGLFYVLFAYAATIGYGPDQMLSGFGTTDKAPFDTISRRYGGDVLTVLVDLAGLISAFGAALAIVNGGARILFSVARDGLMPRPLAWIHPQRQTPVGAVVALCALGLGVGLPLCFAVTPNLAYNFLGLLDALFILLIYALVSVACFRFFRRKRRAQFKVVRHGFVPILGLVISGVILLLTLLSTVIAPDFPIYYAIPIVVGVWLALGIAGSLLVRIKPAIKPAA